MLTLPGFLLLLIVRHDVLSAFEWQANEIVLQQNYPKSIRKELNQGTRNDSSWYRAPLLPLHDQQCLPLNT